MNILFISKHRSPHIGGVEKHIEKIKHILESEGYKIKVISEEDIKYPKYKFMGLLFIWSWFIKNIKIIKNSDLIHIHDVFIWYLPFRLIFPNKKVYITHHGWEGKYPIPLWNILNKKIANYLCNGSISVGKFVDKYYKIKSTYTIYGAADKVKIKPKNKNTLVYLGRLEKDTGLLEFFEYLKVNNKLKVTFVGDGSLISECKKYGDVIGNASNIQKYLETAEYCVPSGYLSYFEAKNCKCKIITFANNKLKKDYWNDVKSIKLVPTWNDMSNIYINLWNNK